MLGVYLGFFTYVYVCVNIIQVKIYQTIPDLGWLDLTIF